MRLWYVVAAVAAALTFAAPASASFPGENGRIVFQSNRAAGALELYSMNPDATDVRRLTWNTVADRLPRFSPDGTRIVFARTVGGIDQDIWIMNADGSGERQLTSGPARDDAPVFTHDGEHVVFQRVAAPVACPCELRIVRADGEGERLLDTGPGNAVNADVSANGKLAFASDRAGTLSIYVGNLRGGPIKRVTVGPGAFGDFRPRWSPRGNDLLFMRDDGTSLNDIYTVHADGTDLRQLTSGPRFEEQAQWSPDGKRIVFGVFEVVTPFGARLHTIDADDGSDERVLPQLAAPLVEDFDDGRIDSARWHQIVSGTGVSIAEEGGRLVADFAAGAIPGGPFNQIATHVGLQCQLAGDFDMQVDYALLAWPAANGLQAFLSGFTTFTSAQIFRESKPWGERYGSWIDPSFAATDTGDTAGSLRLTRSGGVVAASYLGAGGWTTLNSSSRPEPMTAGVGAGDFQTFSGLHVRVGFDDFRIASGAITCPGWWRDSGPDWAAG
jgi:TolB protein